MDEKSIKKMTKNIAAITLFLILAAFSAVTAQVAFEDKDPVNNFLDCETNCKVLSRALKKYQADRGRYPDTLKELVPKYLKAIPKCPVAKKDTYSESYRVYRPMDSTDAERFTFFCKGSYHRAAGVKPNEPLFDNNTGTER